MRVKTLEVFGFKSFAQKTVVNFETGVTAIVGPNGSGKSNIVDSIRWVLGEHNPRDVRAPRLEDVIFNGTDQKAPLSMAEVHLTISNDRGLLPISFTEVTITRRVFRSGETECFINQSPCRLKDIRELLLGTGLGGGTYAIIEQGHIDMILSSKPEERRLPFEEASGVAKYLSKKNETMRRLDEVEEHLVRIADITSEVKRQVMALERQANRARQYKSQWERLKFLELRLTVDELRQGQHRAVEFEQQRHEIQLQQSHLEQQKQSFMGSLEACNSAVSAAQDQLQKARTSILSCANDIEQHTNQIALKNRWIETLTQQMEQITQDLEQLRQKTEQWENQLSRFTGALGEVDTQLKTVEAQLGQDAGELTETEEHLSAIVKAVDETKQLLFAVASEAASQRNKVNDASAKLRSVEAQLGRIDGQRMQQATHSADLRARRERAVTEKDRVRADYENIQSRVGASQKSLDEAAARRHELTGRIHELRDQLSKQRAQVELLEELWRKYEGFSGPVKELMTQGITGVLGPLADLVQPSPGFEEVVEAALGPLSEAIVVADRDAMARCREALAAQGLQAARFLVLTDCPMSPVPMDQYLAVDGASRSVRELVRVEPAYQPLIDWVLNDAVMVDDLSPLLAEETPTPKARVVSRRGDRWDRRSWRLVGAAASEIETMAQPDRRLGRKQRWEQVRQSTQGLEQGVRRVETELAQAEEEWQSLLRSSESAKGELAHLTPTLQRLESESAQLINDLSRIEEQQQGRNAEVSDLSEQQTQLRQALTQAQQDVAEAESRHQLLDKQLGEQQQEREAADQRRQQLRIARAQIESSVSSLRERRDAVQAQLKQAEADRDALLKQQETKTRQQDEARARIEDLQQQLDLHRQECERLAVLRQTLDAEAVQAAQAVQIEEEKRNQVLPQVLAVEQKLSAITTQIQERSQHLSEYSYRRNHLIERLQEIYQIDEPTLSAELHSEGPPMEEIAKTEVTQEVQKLRAKLEGIGPVSLGSVEEYDQLKQRLEFLQAQQLDLTQAREDLKTSIAQINKTARTQFKETFEQVRKEFQHYYTRLFNGGQADLILMDETDVLETGIDIVARPPGKRLQSISLLSGGERALTAIALLFALFKVRPSPFCILDEIDAPLDEANVDRFTRVLEEFLDLSQFILITHNKKTITKADCLYGVTMQEAGISRVLSAKFKTAAPNESSPVAEPAAA